MVQIQSKQERSFIANSLRNLVPDILIAWAGAFYFDVGVLGFFGIIVGLQCLYFLIWLKTFLWIWLLFWVSGRKKMAHLIEDSAPLHTACFPTPQFESAERELQARRIYASRPTASAGTEWTSSTDTVFDGTSRHLHRAAKEKARKD